MRLALLLSGFALAISGCVVAKRPPSVAIAIVPVGIEAVSSAQAAQVQQALQREIHSAGYTLAESAAAADFVLTVAYIQTTAGGRIKIASLEPSVHFRDDMAGNDTPEVKEFRRLQRDLQQAVERQGLHPDSS